MKTQFNNQAKEFKYLTLVLAGVFFLILLLLQTQKYKADNHNFFINSPKTENLPVIILKQKNAVKNIENVKANANITSVLISEKNDLEPVILDWMVDKAAWELAPKRDVAVEITEWMLETTPWVDEPINEDLIVMENWMLDTVAWELNENSIFTSKRKDSINLKRRLVDEKAWIDSIGKNKKIINEDVLLTVRKHL